MNDKEIMERVPSSVYRQCRERGYAAPVDVLMDIGVLTKQSYENWRFGKVDYLERVCNCNLHKLATIMMQIKVCSKKAGYKPSYCCYKQWGVKRRGGQGKKPVIRLRFSKSGDPAIEQAYATHYVDTKRCAELKSRSDKTGDDNADES